MALRQLVLFRDAKGHVPLQDWLDSCPQRLRARVLAQMRILAIEGHNLRRPRADYLRDGIYELRIKQERLQYRLLYAFDGQEVVLMSHALLKQQSKVDPKEIDLAIARLELYLSNRDRHSHNLENES